MKIVKMDAILTTPPGKDRKGSSGSNNDAAYRELAKHCKDEIMADPLDESDDQHEIEVANVSESYDEQYENLNGSYFPNGSETIALKVIDNQLSKCDPSLIHSNSIDNCLMDFVFHRL